MSRAEADRRWWIGEGNEPCRFCLQGYAIEVETRCQACDEPGCVHCVKTITTTEGPLLLCDSCAAGSAPRTASGGR